MHDIGGKLLGIILAFLLAVVVPFVTITTENEMINRRLIIQDTCNFIDTVIDTREISKGAIAEFTTALASYGSNVSYDITVYRRTVSSVSGSGEDYTITFIPDPNYNAAPLNQGDKIEVHVYTTGNSTTANIAQRLSGVVLGNLDETIVARIR